MAESKSGHDFFLFDPHGNEAVDRIYDLVIETRFQANHFCVILACELTQNGFQEEVVTNAVRKTKSLWRT